MPISRTATRTSTRRRKQKRATTTGGVVGMQVLPKRRPGTFEQRIWRIAPALRAEYTFDPRIGGIVRAATAARYAALRQANFHQEA